jgi:adenylate cyclase
MVKNIAEPVRAWRIRLDSEAAAIEGARSSEFGVRSSGSKIQSPKSRRVGIAHRKGVVVAVGLLLIAGALTVLWYSSLPSIRVPQSAIRNQEVLPLPDKPSIVVLPFANMSSDPGQEYFSDGITEVLTSDLSRISSLFVISRNTAFTYKGKPQNTQEVSKELGVRYVLEGSVQKAGEQVRIVAQLIDAPQDYHVWTQRYDRPWKDIFTLQDEIVQEDSDDAETPALVMGARSPGAQAHGQPGSL